MNAYTIYNSSGFKWGNETYSSREEALKALREFWGKVKVDFNKFEIREAA